MPSCHTTCGALQYYLYWIPGGCQYLYVHDLMGVSDAAEPTFGQLHWMALPLSWATSTTSAAFFFVGGLLLADGHWSALILQMVLYQKIYKTTLPRVPETTKLRIHLHCTKLQFL